MSGAAAASGPARAGQAGPSQAAALVREWRESWRQGLAALIGAAFAYSIWTSVSSLFVQPLQDAFGWSRGEIALAHNSGLVVAFLAPLIGRLVDRIGVRPVLVTGLVGTAASYLMFAAMTGSLVQYYAIYFIGNVFGMCTTGITYTRVVVGAFRASRGSALAISRSGIALSTATMPLLLYWAIGSWGFSGGFVVLAALVALISLPLALLWIPAVGPRDPRPRQEAEASRWSQLVRRPKVLLLCAASALNYAPVGMLLTQMVPLAVSKDLSAAEGVAAVSLVGLAAMAGALLSGFLVDRFWAPAVAFVLNVAPAIGCLFLLTDSVSPLLFYAAVLMVGLGQGAEIDIVAFMAARYFGMRNYASIYGLSVLCIALAIAVSASAIGVIYDAFGSYDLGLVAASASFALAALCYLMMGRYPTSTPD